MSKEDNGGSAFPSGERYQTYHHMSGSYSDHSKAPLHAGMALRDYFAAKAMQAIVIGNGADISCMGIGAAKDAYELADAMLEARKK